MSRRTKPGFAVSLCAAFIIAMTACGSSSADEAPIVGADASASTVASTPEAPSAAETTEAPTLTDEGEAPTDDETDDGSPDVGDEGDEGDDADGEGSCIEGDWAVSEEELNSYYEEFGAVAGIPMSATGMARIRFIDLQFVYDAVFDLTMDLGGEITVASSNGVATGSYVFEDGIISTELAANSVSVTVNVAGFEMDAGDLGNDLLSSIPINDAPYSCDGPTIFFETGGAERHPIKLTPYEG